VARIWVYAEIVEGKPKSVALELLTKARALGEPEAVALGRRIVGQARGPRRLRA